MCTQKRADAPRYILKVRTQKGRFWPSAVMTLQGSKALSEAAKGAFLSWAACMQDSKGDGLAGGDHHSSPAPKEEVKESLGKKKKGQKQQTLLFTTTQRRY